MSEVKEKSSPSISTFGAAITRGKIGGDAKQAEETITGIMRTWKHLVHGGLADALKEFGVMTRASAQMVVTWIGQYTIVQDIFDTIEELIYGKDRDRKREWWRQWRKKISPGASHTKT